MLDGNCIVSPQHMYQLEGGCSNDGDDNTDGDESRMILLTNTQIRILFSLWTPLHSSQRHPVCRRNDTEEKKSREATRESQFPAPGNGWSHGIDLGDNVLN